MRREPQKGDKHAHTQMKRTFLKEERTKTSAALVGSSPGSGFEIPRHIDHNNVAISME